MSEPTIALLSLLSGLFLATLILCLSFEVVRAARKLPPFSYQLNSVAQQSLISFFLCLIVLLVQPIHPWAAYLIVGTVFSLFYAIILLNVFRGMDSVKYPFLFSAMSIFTLVCLIGYWFPYESGLGIGFHLEALLIYSAVIICIRLALILTDLAKEFDG